MGRGGWNSKQTILFWPYSVTIFLLNRNHVHYCSIGYKIFHLSKKLILHINIIEAILKLEIPDLSFFIHTLVSKVDILTFWILCWPVYSTNNKIIFPIIILNFSLVRYIKCKLWILEGLLVYWYLVMLYSNFKIVNIWTLNQISRMPS